MVAMCMGDEDCVRASERLQVDRRPTMQMRDTAAQQRVGQQPDAIELDKHSRMADVEDAAHGASMRHAGTTVSP